MSFLTRQTEDKTNAVTEAKDVEKDRAAEVERLEKKLADIKESKISDRKGSIQ